MRHAAAVAAAAAVTRAAGPVAALVVATLLTPRAASGQEPTSPDLPPHPAPHEHPSLVDRPHTVAELEAGILALPGQPISAANRGGATPLGTVGNGDATVETGIHLLYRPTGEWAIGASATFAPHPTSDSSYGASGVSRTHARSYLQMGGEARYYPLRSRWFEAWAGLRAGAVIIGDRFTTNDAPAVPPILGVNTVTVSTEGFSLGVQVGGDYVLTDNLVIGMALRADRWILPTEKPFSQESSCDAIGDCPTLTGTAVAFELGITVGYRIPL
jgi:hypothetical protein